MIVKLLTEHHLEFLSLKGDCTGSSESTHVKMPHCWKSHVMAHIIKCVTILRFYPISLESLSDHILNIILSKVQNNMFLSVHNYRIFYSSSR